MLAALLLVALQLFIIYSVQKKRKTTVLNTKFNRILMLSLLLTITQIVLGTDVREHVDTIAKTGAPEIFWLQNPSVVFYIHRSFSIVVLVTNLYLFALNSKLVLGFSKIKWVIFLISLEIISGILMYYFAFPFGTQTIHLAIATLLFGIQFYMILESKSDSAMQ
jgi:cytochrome c oxidase assembly protein subunit 15